MLLALCHSCLLNIKWYSFLWFPDNVDKHLIAKKLKKTIVQIICLTCHSKQSMFVPVFYDYEFNDCDTYQVVLVAQIPSFNAWTFIWIFLPNSNFLCSRYFKLFFSTVKRKLRTPHLTLHERLWNFLAFLFLFCPTPFRRLEAEWIGPFIRQPIYKDIQGESNAAYCIFSAPAVSTLHWRQNPEASLGIR